MRRSGTRSSRWVTAPTWCLRRWSRWQPRAGHGEKVHPTQAQGLTTLRTPPRLGSGKGRGVAGAQIPRSRLPTGKPAGPSCSRPPGQRWRPDTRGATRATALHVSFSTPSRSGYRRPLGLDVLVQTEHIGRVIGMLQADQALVFGRAVGRAHPVLAFVAHVVNVGAPGGKRLHLL